MTVVVVRAGACVLVIVAVVKKRPGRSSAWCTPAGACILALALVQPSCVLLSDSVLSNATPIIHVLMRGYMACSYLCKTTTNHVNEGGFGSPMIGAATQQ